MQLILLKRLKIENIWSMERFKSSSVLQRYVFLMEFDDEVEFLEDKHWY